MRAGSRYGLEIRSALPVDAPFLVELLAGAGVVTSASELASRLTAVRASPGAVLMASDWGPPIGLVTVQWAPGLLVAEPVARVSALLVAPDARRRGVARALLKAASQAARAAGCGELELSVPHSVADLLAFAVATGFTPLGGILSRPLRKGRV